MLQWHPVKFANLLVEAAEIKKGFIKKVAIKTTECQTIWNGFITFYPIDEFFFPLIHETNNTALYVIAC